MGNRPGIEKGIYRRNFFTVVLVLILEKTVTDIRSKKKKRDAESGSNKLCPVRDKVLLTQRFNPSKISQYRASWDAPEVHRTVLFSFHRR
jgi:hypothetical protein